MRVSALSKAVSEIERSEASSNCVGGNHIRTETSATADSALGSGRATMSKPL